MFVRLTKYLYKSAIKGTNTLYSVGSFLLTLVEVSAKTGYAVLLIQALPMLVDPTIPIYSALAVAGSGLFLNEIGKAIPHVRMILLSKVSTSLADTLTNEVMDKFYKLPMEYRISNTNAPAIQHFGASYERLSKSFVEGLLGQTVSSTVEIITVTSLLSRYYGYMGLAALGALAVYSITGLSSIRKIKEAQGLYVQDLFCTYEYLIDQLDRGETAHLYGNVTRELQNLNETLSRLNASDNNRVLRRNISKLLQGATACISFAAISAYAGYLTRNTNYKTNDYIWIVLLLNQLSSALDQFTESGTRAYGDYTDFVELMNYLDLPEETQLHPSKNVAESSKIKEVQAVSVEFDDVSFSIGDKKILSNISFKLPAGKTSLITGLSGEGKTTILKLLLGFYRPTSGVIRINGIDTQALHGHELRELAAVVPQKATLFNRSIVDNIRYGNLSSTDSQVIKAAKRAGLPLKLMTSFLKEPIGEKGSKLSGGQQQRISIARAYVREKSPILVMDEPTSALDAETERDVLKSLSDLIEISGKTTFVVTHKLSSVIYFNNIHEIIVINGGKICERGDLKTLMSLSGPFARQINLAYHQAKQCWDHIMDGKASEVDKKEAEKMSIEADPEIDDAKYEKALLAEATVANFGHDVKSLAENATVLTVNSPLMVHQFRNTRSNDNSYMNFGEDEKPVKEKKCCVIL